MFLAKNAKRYEFIFKIIIRLFIIIGLVCGSVKLLTTELEKSYSYTYDLTQFGGQEGKLRSPQSAVNEGEYDFEIVYKAAKDISYSVQMGSDDELTGVLPACGSYSRYIINFETEVGTDNLYLNLYDDAQALTLKSVKLIGDESLYADVYVRLIILIINCIAAWIVVNIFFDADRQKRYAILILLFAVTFLNMIHAEGIIRFSGDIRFHLTRINGVKDSIEDGMFPAIIFPHSFHGHGEIGALYPNAFIYPFAIIRVMGVSLMMTYKILTYLINVFTVLIAYKCAKSLTENRIYRAIAATVYSVYPYRMFVMTASGSAAGRGFAIMFLPLMIAGIHRIVSTDKDYKEDKKYFISSILMLAIGASGILNSHVLCFIIAVIMAVIICIRYYKNMLKVQTLGSLAISAIICIALGSMSIALLLGYIDSGLNIGYLEHDLYIKLDSVKEFLRSPWNIFTFFLAAGTIAIHILNRKKMSKNIVISIIGLVLIAVMSTDLIPYYRLMKYDWIDQILSTFQNMKRLYFVSEILVALCTIKALEVCANKRQRFVFGGAVLVVLYVCSFYTGLDYVHSGFLADPVVAYTEHEGALEYLPEGTEVSDFTSNVAYVSDESALKVISYEKDGYDAEVYYTCSREGVYADLPMFYYRDTKCVDGKGNELPVETGDKNHVRIFFEKTDEIKCIRVFYDINPIYTYIFALCLLCTAAMLVVLAVYKKR